MCSAVPGFPVLMEELAMSSRREMDSHVSVQQASVEQDVTEVGI